MKCKFCGAEVAIGTRCEYCGSIAERSYYFNGVLQEAENEGKSSSCDYIVQKGDNLWNISKRFYGAGSEYHRIVKANKISNPNLIYPGQKLKIPGKGRR